MKEWILGVGTIIIIITIASLILPEGKMGKFIKCYFSLIVVLVVLNPLVNFNFDEFYFGFNENTATETVQVHYIDYVNQQKITKLQNNCIKICENYGINKAEVIIQYSVDDFIIKNHGAEIKLYENVKNLNVIEKVKIDISNYLDVEVDKIIVKYCEGENEST